MEFKECPDVRLAEPEDIPEIMRLFSEYLTENGVVKYSEEKIVSIIALHYNKNGGIIGVIGEVGQRLKGALVLVVQQGWFNEDYHLQELSLYVDKENRKIGRAHV